MPGCRLRAESFAGNPIENFNDVWASSDAGLTWKEINHAAPFAQRGYYDLDITNEGVIILSAGRADNSTAYNPTRRNDVWASMDGGYRWGLCVEDAESAHARCMRGTRAVLSAHRSPWRHVCPSASLCCALTPRRADGRIALASQQWWRMTAITTSSEA